MDPIGEIEASLNSIPFDSFSETGPAPDSPFLTGTCQFTLTGLGSWLVTFQNGVHTSVRCGENCEPPPDATFTCSPETYLHVLHRDGGWNAEIARLQGYLTITGDEALARAVLSVGAAPSIVELGSPSAPNTASGEICTVRANADGSTAGTTGTAGVC